MAKITYIEKNFRSKALAMIQWADGVCQQYARQGYSLTLRQLYYQAVASDLIPNKMTEYKNLGSVINDARLAGLIDWSHLEDRTRNLQENSHWSTPSDIMDSAAASYRVDLWARQPTYVEVWIEKDALIGVIERPCRELDVPYFSCRGYTSQSEMWTAAQRIIDRTESGWKPCTIIHLGDHDPSGIDMSRDIWQRLCDFCVHDGVNAPHIERIALNMDQVQQYNPPPNPAKITDSRAVTYIANHGPDSWELDALRPEVLDQLIRSTVESYIDEDLWEEDKAIQAAGRQQIRSAAASFRENA